MASGKINKYFILLMKVIFSLLTLLFAYFMYALSRIFIVYDYKKINYDFIIILILIFGLYFYLLTSITILIAFFKKFKKFKSYIIFFVPFIPILSISLWIYQSREFSNIDFSLLSSLYMPFFIITLFFVTKRSYDVIGYVVGKEIGFLGDDYFAISVLLKPIEAGEADLLIKHIINNLLKYEFIKVSSIDINNKKYKVLNFRKRKPTYWAYENILLTELYIEVTDNFQLVNIVDGYDYEKNVYKCMYIYQYYDDGDKIASLSSTDNAVYLAIKGILPEDTLIYYHKDDNITPREIISLHYELFNKYFIIRYGTLIDKLETKLKDSLIRLKEPYKKGLKYIIYLIITILIIIYLYINKYLPILNTETILLIILGFPPFIHYSIKIYERFVLKKKE
ncbi:Uncharacterised protein [uncultured archaeon]|nr:Uncharacterised protein [uncultured archaeon]